MTKKLDLGQVAPKIGAKYPAPFHEPCATRRRQPLAKAAGLTKVGVNRLTLPPGAWSSQRHYHSHDDELVWVLEGEVTLVTNAGEEVLHAGDCAGFKAGDKNGHHFQNRSSADVVLLEVGTGFDEDETDYPDIDMRAVGDGYVHRDGRPYPERG